MLGAAILPVAFFAGYPVNGPLGGIAAICGAISALTAVFAKSLDAYFIAGGVAVMFLSAIFIT